MYSILVLPNSDPCIHKEVHKSKIICMKWTTMRQVSIPYNALS